MSDNSTKNWSVREVAEWLDMNDFADGVQEKFIAEDIDGKCLFDMHKCGLNGLDLGLLALERFRGQLQFKSLLNELFISENVIKAAPEVTLSAIQKRVLLTKKKFIRDSLKRKWPGNLVPTFGKYDSKENRVELEKFVEDNVAEWELEYFDQKSIFQFCINVMKERRRKIKNGYDYTKPHGNKGRQTTVLQAPPAPALPQIEVALTSTSTPPQTEVTTTPFQTEVAPLQTPPQTPRTQSQSTPIYDRPSLLFFSTRNDMSTSSVSYGQSQSLLSEPNVEELFDVTDVTQLNAGYIVRRYEKEKYQSDISNSRLRELSKALGVKGSRSTRQLSLLAVARAMIQQKVIIVTSKKFKLSNVICGKELSV